MNLSTMTYRNHAEVRPSDWPWEHFSPREMADRETGELLVSPAFMDWLAVLRAMHGKPMVVSSGYRTPLHQFTRTGRRTGAHVDGMAIDVLCSGQDAERLERLAVGLGVLGRGIQQSSSIPHRKRYLHLDMWTKAPDGLRPRVWSY